MHENFMNKGGLLRRRIAIVKKHYLKFLAHLLSFEGVFSDIIESPIIKFFQREAPRPQFSGML